jgi:hypothetical protein
MDTKLPTNHIRCDQLIPAWCNVLGIAARESDTGRTGGTGGVVLDGKAALLLSKFDLKLWTC